MGGMLFGRVGSRLLPGPRLDDVAPETGKEGEYGE